MTIRKLEASDIGDVSTIITRNFDEVMAKYHSKAIIETFKKYNTPEKLEIQMNWKEIYVVEEDVILATGAVANFGSTKVPKFVISNFFVIPEAHRRGIGRKLLIHLLNIVKTKGVSTLSVPSSRTGFGFYAKMGFQKDFAQPDTADEITWMTMKL
jgi:ribosomal protein S18 acetylase RimI-like enzyme